MVDEREDTLPLRKENRQRRETAARTRPVVHGALPYHGHRADPKHERRRVAEAVKEARKRA